MNKKHDIQHEKLATVDTANGHTVRISKSTIKRDAEILKKLGSELVKLSKNELAKIPLDDDLLHAIELAKKIKKESYRRQIQWIGKLLRNRNIEAIKNALDKLKNRHNSQNMLLRKLEKLRDNLIENGDTEHIMSLFPAANRQLLRNLARSAKEEKHAHKSAKQLYQYLKELSEGEQSL